MSEKCDLPRVAGKPFARIKTEGIFLNNKKYSSLGKMLSYHTTPCRQNYRQGVGALAETGD